MLIAISVGLIDIGYQALEIHTACTFQIERDIIKTTLPKAKELRRFIEPLITLGKEDTVANRRHAFSKLRSDSAVAKLFTEVSINAKERKGGYTRIIKAGFRYGDDAPMAIIELVDRDAQAKKVDKPKKVETKEKESAPVAASK